jgi:hypothetical protein
MSARSPPERTRRRRWPRSHVADTDRASAEEVKALAWDAPANPEHMDYVAIERQMALHRLPIPAIPVTVVTADAGQSATNPDEQKIWLTRQLSHRSPCPSRRARDL